MDIKGMLYKMKCFTTSNRSYIMTYLRSYIKTYFMERGHSQGGIRTCATPPRSSWSWAPSGAASASRPPSCLAAAFGQAPQSSCPFRKPRGRAGCSCSPFRRRRSRHPKQGQGRYRGFQLLPWIHLAKRMLKARRQAICPAVDKGTHQLTCV